MEKALMTFYSFSGADMVVRANGKAIGELQEIKYTEDIRTGLIKGYVVAAVFPQDSDVKESLLKADEIEVYCMTEDGYFREELITGVEFQEIERSRCIDDIVFTTKYHFIAKKVEESTGKKDFTEGLPFPVEVVSPIETYVPFEKRGN